MTPRLRILSNVIERLSKLKTAVNGHVYGVMCETALTVLAFSVESKNEEQEETTITNVNLQLSMPVEIDLLGVLFVDQCEQKIPDAFQDIDVTDNPLILKYWTKESSVQPFFYIHQKLETAGDFEIVSEDYVCQHFVYIRLLASLPLFAEKENVVDTLQESRKKIASGKVAFYFPQSNVYLFGNDSESNLKESSAKEILNSVDSHENSKNQKNHKKSSSHIVNAVPVDMLLKLSNDKATDGAAKHAPVIHQQTRRHFEFLEFNLKIDALSLVERNTTLSRLYEVLVESVCRNLRLIGKSFEEQIENNTSKMKLPIPMHFKPTDFGHLMTIAYLAESTAKENSEYRKSLHKTLVLGMTRPMFREGNAVQFRSDLSNNDPLFNPHEAISVSNTPNGKLSLVYGCYSYHHYMQDNFDDNGWGCAYRSLQTIISWYRLQGYTEKSILNHKDIQKCLVKIGDKPGNFIGSKQWIGSTEVGFVLETFLDISIKVLCASSGDEMKNLVPNLAYHFETQGTPVMIGGGVLAHTILGVSLDDTTGEVRFLILDPHYTGAENLSTIINKGWCGWKTKEFWKKDAFYNMCLPQRPFCF
ncbi:ufm1-specific protease 2 [Leptopilina boulardi]|uniref:ufm1-specific protease 2 n=1 Tax=Leptopilina boulardi TaxID=63433 RepID=UPI0021F61964|nr:ufm1-specific protease 2 [Leptopilina boulardi]